MFTGLVEEIGTVRRVRRTGSYQTVQIEAHRVLEETALGDSIAIDGACQTVTEIGRDYFSVETLAASLDKTTLGDYRTGRRVNLERALTPDRRLGGHFVQGHVDGVARVDRVEERGRNVYFSVEIPEELRIYCVGEGSVALDGVSLTIAEIEGNSLTINVIPTTWRETVLIDRAPGDTINVEVDIIGRYVARMLGMERPGAHAGSASGLTAERLTSLGY